MAVSGFKIQYLLFPVFWWCPGITIQSELHCTKCYAITQHEILFLPLWTSLSTYTVQICSCLVLELDVVYLSGLIADHVHIQIRSSLLTHYGMMQDKQPSAAGGGISTSDSPDNGPDCQHSHLPADCILSTACKPL